MNLKYVLQIPELGLTLFAVLCTKTFAQFGYNPYGYDLYGGYNPYGGYQQQVPVQIREYSTNSNVQH